MTADLLGSLLIIVIIAVAILGAVAWFAWRVGTEAGRLARFERELAAEQDRIRRVEDVTEWVDGLSTYADVVRSPFGPIQSGLIPTQRRPTHDEGEATIKPVSVAMLMLVVVAMFGILLADDCEGPNLPERGARAPVVADDRAVLASSTPTVNSVCDDIRMHGHLGQPWADQPRLIKATKAAHLDDGALQVAYRTGNAGLWDAQLSAIEHECAMRGWSL